MTEQNLKQFAAFINMILDSTSILTLEENDSEDYISSYDKDLKVVYLDSKYVDGKEINGSYSILDQRCISALAHEKRHIYQSENLSTTWEQEFNNYKNPGDGLEEYLLQEIEVDANAFSRVIQDRLFGSHKTFTGKVETAIAKRTKAIEGTYLPKINKILGK